MYKVITSLWSKPKSSSKAHYSPNSKVDEDSWVFVSDAVMVTPSIKNNLMTNSWIASPPLIKNDESSTNVHNFNPIENLLIEHASMSVYDQISSKTRNRRQKKIINDNKLDEQVEEVEEEGGEDDDDEDDIDDDDNNEQITISRQYPNITSVHYRNLNISTNSSVTTLESSTSSLVAHHRHLHRLHQRRKRSNKSSTSKLVLTNNVDDSKQVSNKSIERQRLNHTRTSKILLQQPSRLHH
ncbi:unnamed protein product [Adineta steineri]|uniref:Uncharacterized protein n=1 Tax=Adineta steineri TaxID=433720 RepID=A0A813ZVP4_9BILA|nr:unnamed protein product [Adineta steineri]CAF3868272.1 unnamed protein product [Adineta steineri]